MHALAIMFALFAERRALLLGEHSLHDCFAELGMDCAALLRRLSVVQFRTRLGGKFGDLLALDVGKWGLDALEETEYRLCVADAGGWRGAGGHVRGTRAE